VSAEYDIPDEKGETKRERNTRFGISSPGLVDISDDPDCQRMVALFWQVSRLRTSNMGGPDPLMPQTILSWLQMKGDVLLREEMALLLDMDMAFLSAWRRERRKEQEAEKERREYEKQNTPKQRPYP
jgi:hypothetical protein